MSRRGVYRLKFSQQLDTPGAGLWEVRLYPCEIVHEREVSEPFVDGGREIAIQVAQAEVPTQRTVAHPQEFGERPQRVAPEASQRLDVLAAEHGLANKVLAHEEPDLKFPTTLVSLRRQRAFVQRPRAQPIALVEQETSPPVALDFEVLIRRSRSKKAQIDQKKLAAVLQFVVATWGNNMAGGDGRHRLE